MNIFPALRSIASALFGLCLAGCTAIGARPDLVRLYENADNRADQPPLILIHGVMGSTLVEAHTGKQFWPGSLGTMAFSDYRGLARMNSADREGEGLVPGDLVYGMAGLDYYAALVQSLEQVGHFKRGQPGVAVADSDRRRYYVLLYDWRKDNVEAARKLHSLIDQIRLDYRDPALRVDIIAHSNGGLIANYYLRYGPTDVLDQGLYQPWNEGPQRIRRVVMLGTPSLGAVVSVERLLRGFRFGLRTVPVEVMATFATPFQSLPHPLSHPIVDISGKPVAMDLYDPESWRTRRWSVYSPEVEARVRTSADNTEAGDKAVTELQATFNRHLRRALRFQWALAAPFPDTGVEIAVFGGDCKSTQAKAVLVEDDDGSRLAFKSTEVPLFDATRPDGMDYERLLFEPGDGLVTRASQVAREVGGSSQGHPYLPIVQTFFLCESHVRLTGNPYFQNNLLYFLLAR